MLWTIITAVSLLAFFLAFLLWKLVSEHPCVEIPMLGIKNSGCIEAFSSASIDWTIVSFEKIQGNSKELLGELVLAPGDAPPPAEDHRHYGQVFGFKDEEFVWWAYAENNDAILFFSRDMRLTLRVIPTNEPGVWQGRMNNSAYRISTLYPAADLVAQNRKSWEKKFAKN